MSDMFTPDYDIYKGKSIAEMIDILNTALETLQQNFPEPGAHSQVLRSDIDNLCERYRDWADDSELAIKVAVSKDIAKQMRKDMYAMGSLLMAVDNVHTGVCRVSLETMMAADGFLNEVDDHLRSLCVGSADAKKELEKKREKDKKDEKKDKKDEKKDKKDEKKDKKDEKKDKKDEKKDKKDEKKDKK